MFEQYIATSIEELFDIVEKINGFELKWFRGQSLSRHKLQPSLYRENKFHSDFFGREGSENISFRGRHGNYHILNYEIGDQVMLEFYGDLFSRAQRMYKNQHNGVPTQLLDFTTDMLIALFFCVEERAYWDESHGREVVQGQLSEDSYGGVDEAGSIYIIDPIHLNRKSCSHEEVISEEKIDQYLINPTPIAIDPPIINERIKAQKGKFIHFGDQLEELEYYNILCSHLVKIHIPNKYKPSIYNDLLSKGISYKSVYPDVVGFSMHARHLMSEEFKNRK